MGGGVRAYFKELGGDEGALVVLGHTIEEAEDGEGGRGGLGTSQGLLGKTNSRPIPDGL